MHERRENPIRPTISNAKNVLAGYKIARERAGRDLVDRGISSYFVLIVGAFLAEEISPETTANVYQLEDIIERQNCAGDEINAESMRSPYWEREHFSEEYSELIVNISNQLETAFDVEEGRERTRAIIDSLDNWFETNETVEDYMSGRLSPVNLDKHMSEILEPLLATDAEKKPQVYRDTVNSAWLGALLTVVTEGDREKTDKLMDPVLALTSMLQASEDYANVRRDKKVNKTTLMSSIDKKSRVRRVDETLHFVNSLGVYSNQGDFSKGTSGLLKSAVLARGVLCRLKARNGNGEWREEEFFKKCNDFENNINKAYSIL